MFKSLILLSIILTLCPFFTMALPDKHFTSESRLNSGYWVKIKINHSGVQAISFDQLRQWGFENPEKVCVYGFGGAELCNTAFNDNMPDDLEQTYSIIATDKQGKKRLIFYGESESRLRVQSNNSLEYTNNIYENCGYYFLSDRDKRITVTHAPFSESHNKATGHYSASIIQPDNHNHMEGGAFWLGPELKYGEKQEVTFNVKNFATDNVSLVPYGSMAYNGVAANTKTTTNLDIVFSDNAKSSSIINRSALKLNTETTFFNNVTGTARFEPSDHGTLDNSTLRISFNINTKSPDGLNYASLKNVWIIYPRNNDFGNESQLPMTFTAGGPGENFILSSKHKIEVWNIQSPLAVYPFEIKYDSSDGTCEGSFDKKYSSGAGAGKFIAFDPQGELHSPDFDSVVPNQNIHGDPTPDMAIICTDALLQSAIELAEIHRRKGKSVNVYTHRQVLNEFSSGTATPMAYRMMAKMFYDRDPDKFKNLLLYGPATWDYRGIYMDAENKLLTFMAEREVHYKESSANYSNDSWFGMLDDSYQPNKIELARRSIAVGRLNVTDSGSGHDINMKISDYMDNPPDPASFARMLLVACIGDANAHLYQSENLANNTMAINPAFSITKAYNSLYAISNNKALINTANIKAALNRGQGFLDYSGHGDENNLGSGKDIVWSKSHNSQLSNSVLPIAMLSTCSSYSFDRGNADIASSLVFKSGGGAIAAIGACRKVYLAYNSIFNLAIGRAYAEAEPGATIGDIYLKACNMAVENCGNSQGALANNLCYNLCGDPLVNLPVPDCTAVITSINGNAVVNESHVTVPPGDKVEIEGKIMPEAGNLAGKFNGSIRAIVYDGPTKRRQVVTQGVDTVCTVGMEHDILAEASGRVTDGHFSLSMSMPQPRNGGIRNRIILSAIADNGTGHRALGYCDNFIVDDNAQSTNLAEFKAPLIKKLYIDTSEFKNGSILSPDITHNVFATVDASGTGINNSTALIGTQPRLCLDGTIDIPGVASAYTIDEDGNFNFKCKLPDNLASGAHSLKLSLQNTLGEYSSRTLDFILSPSECEITVTVDELPANNVATISMETQATNIRSRLLITDQSGNTVHSASDVQFPYRWNLDDMNGNNVDDGIYTLRVLVANDRQQGVSAPCRIVVIRQ